MWYDCLNVEDFICKLEFVEDWVNLVVLVVNEENVFGGCVVIVLINGVVGIVLVVLYYVIYYMLVGVGDFDDVIV